MKRLKLLIIVSSINIFMFHFNFNWSDMFKSVNAYDNAGNILGNVLGRVIIGGLEDKLEESILKRSLNLKNKETGEIVSIRPGTKVRINLEETNYTFKRYNNEENLIYLKSGALDFMYDYTTLDYISLVLEPKPSVASIGASLLGGAVGFGLGIAVEENSKHTTYSSGGLAMMGCSLGMLAGPAYRYSQERETIDFLLTGWEVH